MSGTPGPGEISRGEAIVSFSLVLAEVPTHPHEEGDCHEAKKNVFDDFFRGGAFVFFFAREGKGERGGEERENEKMAMKSGVGGKRDDT